MDDCKETLERAAESLRGSRRDLLEALRPSDRVGEDVPIPVAEAGGFCCEPEPVSVPSECFVLGAPAVVDVGASAEPADDFVLVVADRLGPREEPAEDPVRPPEAVLELETLATLEGLSPSWPEPSPVFRMDRVHPSSARGLFCRHPGVIEPAAVLVITISLSPRRPDDLGDRFSQETKPPLASHVFGVDDVVLSQMLNAHLGSPSELICVEADPRSSDSNRSDAFYHGVKGFSVGTDEFCHSTPTL